MVFNYLRGRLARRHWLRQLRHPDPRLRERAVRELGEWRDPQFRAPLLAACSDPDDQVRGWALSYASDICDDQLPRYLAAASDSSPFVREKACGALRYSSREAIPVLLKALSDEAPMVRLEAVLALGSLDAEEAEAAITVLQQSDPHDDVRDYATSVLEDFARRRAPYTETVEEEDVDVPLAPVAIDTLLARLQDPDEDTRADAALGLAATAEPRGYAPLLGLLKNEPSGYVRRRVLWALSFYPAEQCIPLLTESLGDPHESVRYQAVVALQELCDVEELEMLLAHLPERVHADVKDGLAQAIAEWDGLPAHRLVRLGTVFYE